MDFAIPAEHKLKIKKKNEKRVKHLDLTKVLKNLLNIKMTVIPIVIGALGTIPKGLIRRKEEKKV